MFHVLPKTGSVLEAGEESVGVTSGTPREVLAHGEVQVLGISSLKARIDERRSSTSSGEASSRTAINTT